MRAHQVKVQRVATAAREYDAITVVIGDLHLRCDAHDDRSIRLARRLADDHGAAFMYDNATAERVRDALNLPDEVCKLLTVDRFEAAMHLAADTCLEKHANGNFKYDTREECAEAIRQIAINQPEQLK